MDDKILRTLRTMAWERAKGELMSMAQTFWGNAETASCSSQFEKFKFEMNVFIKNIEDHGLHE